MCGCHHTDDLHLLFGFRFDSCVECVEVWCVRCRVHALHRRRNLARSCTTERALSGTREYRNRCPQVGVRGGVVCTPDAERRNLVCAQCREPRCPPVDNINHPNCVSTRSARRIFFSPRFATDRDCSDPHMDARDFPLRSAASQAPTIGTSPQMGTNSRSKELAGSSWRF